MSDRNKRFDLIKSLGTRPRLIITFLALVAVSACSPSSSEIDGDTTAELSARAVAQACGSACINGTVYVLDGLLYADTLEGEEEPMPDETRTALADVFDEVEFVADTSGLVDGGVLVGVSPVDELAEGVVGVDVGVMRSEFDFRGETILFQWDGETWVLATSEDTGVTVTSAVS
ncbi:MAG TPA: hypothetical protein VNT92_12290 [Acidimicrobiia bacterium]|nr:hypothetical protein [Acidimicrobiia bacterium]